MGRPFDLMALKAACAAWPPSEGLPQLEGEGLFERIRQILVDATQAGRLRCGQDLIPLIRQALIRAGHGRERESLRVPNAPGWPDERDWRGLGFTVIPQGTDSYLVACDVPTLEWLEAGRDLFDDAFVELPVRPDQGVRIDPFLEATTGFSHYFS
jgi:hypothetical protein